jgi:hypothetical protein
MWQRAFYLSDDESVSSTGYEFDHEESISVKFTITDLPPSGVINFCLQNEDFSISVINGTQLCDVNKLIEKNETNVICKINLEDCNISGNDNLQFIFTTQTENTLLSAKY